MRLVDVYSVDREVASDILWMLLSERPPEANISHQQMPTLTEHLAFIEGRPYFVWYLVDVGEDRHVGAVYLTRMREIGVGILRRYRGNQYGRSAVHMLMERHPGRFLANVAPANYESQSMFLDMGFRMISQTYERRARA